MRTSTKQLWLAIVAAMLATFFLLYIGFVRGNDQGFWITFPASVAAIWGFVYKIYDSNNKRKTVENLANVEKGKTNEG
jgi:uncharacterized membrane protein YjjP (DUF1212 family)